MILIGWWLIKLNSVKMLHSDWLMVWNTNLWLVDITWSEHVSLWHSPPRWEAWRECWVCSSSVQTLHQEEWMRWFCHSQTWTVWHTGGTSHPPALHSYSCLDLSLVNIIKCLILIGHKYHILCCDWSKIFKTLLRLVNNIKYFTYCDWSIS